LGRITDYFTFINSATLPNKEERAGKYCHLTITDELVKVRKQTKKQAKKL
jgi:hypothetical protein